MPSREKRELRRERSGGVLPILIVILLLVAGLLVFMLINSLKSEPQEEPLVANYPENPSFVEQKAVTPQPLVIAEGEKASATPRMPTARRVTRMLSTHMGSRAPDSISRSMGRSPR